MGREHFRGSTLTKTAPNSGRSLRIEIHECRLTATQIVGDGKSNGETRLTDAALLC